MNKQRKNIVHAAMRSQVRELLKSELRLKRYSFPKFYVVKMKTMSMLINKSCEKDIPKKTLIQL
jgi:hypothetical protein